MAGAQHARPRAGRRDLAAVSVFIDVEDQRRAVEETGRLAAIVEHSNDFIGFGQSDWAVAYVNEAGRRLVGLPDLDARPAGSRHRRLLPPAEHGRVLAEILPAVERERVLGGRDTIPPFDDGAEVARILQSLPRPGRRSNLLGYGTVTRDLTERRRAGRRSARARRRCVPCSTPSRRHPDRRGSLGAAS